MISDKMTKELNNQVNAELYSAYLYLAMSACATDKDYNGAANWFFMQMQEEMTHAQKIYDYICSQGSRVELDVIEKPPADFESLRQMLEETLAHEKKVTALINGLADLAMEEKDHATSNFLQWFVDEQVEEEESVNDLLAQLKIAGEQGPGLYMLDKSMGERSFAASAEE